MSAFPIPYAGMSADDELIDIMRDLRVLSVACTCADNKLRSLDFGDVATGLDGLIDRLEPVLDFLGEIDFEGCIDRFADFRRQWIERRAALADSGPKGMTGGDRNG